MPRLSAWCTPVVLAGCFADAPALDPDPDTSSEGTSASDTGTDGASSNPTESSATSTTAAPDTGGTDHGSSDDATDDVATDDDGSTGEPARFCDDVPEAIDLCRDFDGASPLAGWYDPVENQGEVSISMDDPFSAPNALVTSVDRSAALDTADAQLASSTDGYPVPVTAFETRVRLWIDDDCAETIETRSAIQFAWVDPDLADDAPFRFNLTIWFAENRVMVAETDSPLGYGGTSHITNIDIPTEQWIDVRVAVSLVDAHVDLVIDGTPLEWPLEHATDDVVTGTAHLPMSFAIGQSASNQPPCVMRYDDYTLDLQ
jgi:hypothetical protein